MPDAQGNFKGQGWSRKKEQAWDRIFAPKPDLTPAQKDGFMKMLASMKP
jgi:hypothetical protein